VELKFQVMVLECVNFFGKDELGNAWQKECDVIRKTQMKRLPVRTVHRSWIS
jgi:hypothetical protein